MKLLDLFEARPPIDNIYGLGAVGASGNIDYLGLRVWVKPSVFLKLAAPHPDPRSDYIEKHIAAGEPIGAPFLNINIPQEWFSDESRYDQVIEGDLSKPANVIGHEGRHRMTAILKIYGDDPVETHILIPGLRRRHLTDRMIERLNDSIVSQTHKLFMGPWFSLTSDTTAAAVQSETINPDILNPDWKEETTINTKIGPVKLVAKHYSDKPVPQIRVDAFINDESIGYVRFIVMDNIKPTGIFSRFKKLNPYLFAGNLRIDDEFQRNGIATAMYKFVKNLGNDIKPSTIQTTKGKAFWTSNPAAENTHVDENFADGKGPGKPGDSARHGIPKGATLAQLDSIGKGKGRKAQLARWQANMRRGRKRATNEAIAPHGSPDNEFELMKAGTKPAALVNPHTFLELYKSVADELGWPYQQIKLAGHQYNNYVVGQPGEGKRVQRLATLVQDMNANLELGIKPDKHYHIEMGRLLGYSDQDIRDFLKKINLDESENAATGAALTVFDIDETLFHTHAKILVIKDDKVVKELDNREFNVYKLGPGEHFDFKQFRDAKFFNDTSVPIDKMWRKAKSTLDTVGRRPGSKVIIVTARSDFDDKDTFLDTFRKHGLDIDKIHVHRAGNLELPSGDAKKKIIGQYLATGEFDMVRLFDDAEVNLRSFLSLKTDYPNIVFKAYMVLEDGSVTEYTI
jgi:hypothetical protein